MKLQNNPKSRTDNMVIQELENEILIYDMKVNKAFCLNKTKDLRFPLNLIKNSLSYQESNNILLSSGL